ncbi:FG-GAP-like repeat-containing protein [Bacteroidota bacterium]
MKTILYILLFLFSLTMIHAQNWERIDSVFSPSGVITSSFAAPIFSDLDSDGDFDLVIGSLSDRIDYYECTKTSPLPGYRKDTSVFYSIYASGLIGTNSAYPALNDLNNDGDLDLVIGGYNGLLYYENIGDSINPVWQENTSIFESVNTQIGGDPKPAFVDLDNDGDLDLLVGIGESFVSGPTPGITIGFENHDTSGTPIYIRNDSFAAGIPDIGLNSYPTLADLDNDNDFDLLFGRDLSSLVYYRNTGTAFSPTWTSSNLFSNVETSSYWKNPTFCDIDYDDDMDLIYGTSDGTIYTYENIGGGAYPQYQFNPEYFEIIKISGGASTVSFADFDNDNDYDLLSGDWLGGFQYFRNDGTITSPSYKKISTNFTGLDAGSYSAPVFVNLDADNDYDIVSGALDGQIYYYVNNGGSFSSNNSTFASIDVGWWSTPAFVDIDNDNDMDLLVGAEYSADCQFYTNDGSNVFSPDNTLISGITFPNYARPKFVDIDNDSDYDIVIGKSNGEIIFYENIGNNVSSSWIINNFHFEGIEVNQNAHPGFADLDNDDRKDLVLGEYSGNFTFYKNLFAPTDIQVKNIISSENIFYLVNYPNPFNPTTKVKFSIPVSSNVKVKIYNTLGQEVITLVNDYFIEGFHEIEWNAENISGGVYFYSCSAESIDGNKNYFSVNKMILLK